MSNLKGIKQNLVILEHNNKVDADIKKLKEEEENRTALIHTKYDLLREQKSKEKQEIQECSHDLQLLFRIVGRYGASEETYCYCLGCGTGMYMSNPNINSLYNISLAIAVPNSYDIDDIDYVIMLASQILSELPVETSIEEARKIIRNKLHEELTKGKAR